MRHIRDTIASHVIHAEVKHVSAIADLFLRNIDARLPIVRQESLTERLGAIRICALTDRKISQVLPKWNMLVDGSRTRFDYASSGALDRRRSKSFLNSPDMGGRCPTAAPDECDAELGVETHECFGEIRRAEVVHRTLWS